MKKALQLRLAAINRKGAAAVLAALFTGAAFAEVDFATGLAAMKTTAEGGIGSAVPIVLGLVGLVIAIGIVLKLVKKS